jgi:hypothetical protein
VPGTKRTPIYRPPSSVVTPRAVDLFKLALTYHDPDPRDPTYANIELELQRELGLKVWHEFVLDITVDDELPAYIKDERSVADWYYVRDLRCALVSMT